MIITRLCRTALYCFSVIMVVIGSIPFIKWEEMVVEGGFVVLNFKPPIQWGCCWCTRRSNSFAGPNRYEKYWHSCTGGIIVLHLKFYVSVEIRKLLKCHNVFLCFSPRSSKLSKTISTASEDMMRNANMRPNGSSGLDPSCQKYRQAIGPVASSQTPSLIDGCCRRRSK